MKRIKSIAVILACAMLAGCGGQQAQTTTEAASTTAAPQTAGADVSLVPTGGCPDEAIDLSELTKCEQPLEDYYKTEEYCYLAVSDGENAAHEAKRCYIGDEFNGLTLSECSTTFYYGDDYESGEKMLFVDNVYAVFEGEITLTGYISVPEGAGEVIFKPDEQEWNGRPLIIGKTDSAAAEIALREFDMDGGDSVRVEATINNLLLKWSNGSSSGLYDYADVVSVKNL